MRVRDSMTRDVITVTPTTPIHEVASLMANHGVSGLPVLDEKGSVIGIVTEADLLVRQKPRTRTSWWRLFLDGDRMAREFQRAVGTTAGEVMTREVISIGPDLPIEAAAAILHDQKIRRVPVVTKGALVGILSRGDLVKALAAGAASVMVGSMLAGTEESPGESFLLEGRRFKVIRGMGSLSAMEEGSADRYFQEGEVSPSKLVPEGIEGRVPYRGPVSDVIFQMIGGLRSGMGYCGVRSIGELRSETEFLRITSAGLRESHPHDVVVTREAPNYSL